MIPVGNDRWRVTSRSTGAAIRVDRLRLNCSLPLGSLGRYPLWVRNVKKADRLSHAAERAARVERYERQEAAKSLFIEICRSFMTREQWDRCYSEAQNSAGETLHIARDLVFALAETQVLIVPRLRKAIENVVRLTEAL